MIIVIPTWRDSLSESETTSWRSLEAHLSDHPRVCIQPEGLVSPLGGAALEFEPFHFSSRDSYSKLLLSHEFYSRFSAYDFILIYQLDCLAFGDDLDLFTGSSRDYFGAPWFVDPARPTLGLSRVGNGGLSLRRVSAALEVLSGTSTGIGARVALRHLLSSRPPDGQRGAAGLTKRLHTLREAARGVQWYTRHYSLNEDHFWSDRAHLFNPAFEVASPREALRFAWEQAPSACAEATGGILPFGCHAWTQWEPAFWQTHIERALNSRR